MNHHWKVIKYGQVLFPILMKFHQGEVDPALQVKMATQLRELALDLGPTYVKFTQILSVRYDLFAGPFCTELQVILDHGRAISYDQIREVIRKELGEAKFTKYIQSISPEPIAVASLGQVHTATLHSGEKVAIKVLHPGIREELARELKAMHQIVGLGEKVFHLDRMQLKSLFAEFEHWTLKETDYTIEAYNINHFSELFKDDKSVRAPKVYWDLTTSQVLVTEFIEGILLKELIQQVSENPHVEDVTYKGMTINRMKYVDLMIHVIMKQYLQFGFIHGDPHPSNIIVTSNEVVAYIDFGIVAKLSELNRQKYEELMISLGSGNLDDIVDKCLVLDMHPGNEDVVKLKERFSELLSTYQVSNSKEFSSTLFFLEVISTGAKLGIEWPMYFALMGKVLATYDGMLQLIAPDINLLDYMRPEFEKRRTDNMMHQMLDPELLLNNSMQAANNLLTLSKELPMETLQLVRDIERNGFPIRITHEESTPAKLLSSNKTDKNPLYFLLMISVVSLFMVRIIDPHLEIAGISFTTVLILLSGVLVLLILYFTLSESA